MKRDTTHTGPLLPPCDGILHVQVVRGEGLLPSTDESVIEVKLGPKGKKQKTPVVNSKGDPEWSDKTLEFAVENAHNTEDCQLQLDVYGYRAIGANDFVGETTIKLDEEFGRKQDWNTRLVLRFPLWDPNGKVRALIPSRAEKDRSRRKQESVYGVLEVNMWFVGVEKPEEGFATSMDVTGCWEAKNILEPGSAQHEWSLLQLHLKP